jgi:hypothetical protein
MAVPRPKGPSSIARTRAALTRRFPEHSAAIDQLTVECERFRELGNDYLECGEVLQRLKELGNTTQHPAHTNYIRERTDEYEELQVGLEEELLECIEERATCLHCGRKNGGKTGHR